MIHLIIPEPIAYQRALCQTLNDHFEGAFVAWFADRTQPRSFTASETFRREFLAEVGYRKLSRALRADPEPIVIVGGWWSGMALKTLLIAFVLRVPFLIWADHPHPRRRNPLFERLRKTYVRFLGRHARGFLACGNPTVEHLAALGISRAKLSNFPYWVRLPETWSVPGGCLKDEMKKRRLRLIAIGRHVPVKNFEVAIEAVALANASAGEPVCGLVMVGDGPELQRLQKIAESRNLEEVVSFTGTLDNRAAHEELRQSDVLVVTSRFEAYGVAVLEALAEGRPVLASDNVTAAIDRDDRSGAITFHPVGDAHRLAKQISELAGDREDLRRRSQAARAIAEQWPPPRAAQILRDTLERTMTDGQRALPSDQVQKVYESSVESAVRPGADP